MSGAATIFDECASLSGNEGARPCMTCDGTGRVVYCHDPDCLEQHACHHVAGEDACSDCGGQGWIPQ